MQSSPALSAPLTCLPYHLFLYIFPAMSSPKLVTAFLRTDAGRVRDHNEDFVVAREPVDAADEAQHGWLYIVADGVGGADAGEVASQFACERTLTHYLEYSNNANWGQRLVDAMQAANTDLRQMVADRNNNSRMATTMVGVVLRDNQAYFVNVGDSRGYLCRQGDIQQVTKDQSLVAKLLEEGAITAEEAEYHPRRNVILYSLGSEKTPKIDLFEVTLQPHDVILLCSDGLTRHVDDEEMAEMAVATEPARATQQLIDLANSRGGQDNISVAILRFATPEEAATQGHRWVSQTSVSQDSMGETAVFTPTSAPATNSKSLWGLTVVLSLVQTFLIVVLWAWLFA
jgi:PPM family protein phosphatase